MEKKLYKKEDGKLLCGVCGGIAEYFGIDPTLVRVGWAVVSCFAFVGVIIAYVVAAVIMPSKSEIM